MISVMNAKRTILVLTSLLLLSGCAVGLLGCGLRQPTLHVAWVETVPRPNGLAEQSWEIAKPLIVMVHRGSGKTAEERPVQLQAVHDGREISIMARWSDHTDTVTRRDWLWDDKREDYVLEEYPVDQFAILWPLTKKASFDMLDGKAAAYDVWQWRARWSDIAGYADDRRLILKPHPKGTRPEQVQGPLYPARRGMVEFCWEEDSGTPGIRPTHKPVSKINFHMPGGESAEAKGSAADVQASGVYTPMLRKAENKDNTWKRNPDGDYWFVEFYRLLLTPYKDEDYQIKGRGPHFFAIAVFDNESGADHFVSGPIRLILGKESKDPT